MRIGTRLTLVLLLCVMPVVAAYTYWSIAWSNVYLNEMKQSARTVSSGVAPAVDEGVIAQEWDKIDDAFRKMDAEGTRSALLRKDGTLWRSSPDFPAALVDAARVQLVQRKSTEFGPTAGAKNWFCELVPLKGKGGEVIGYLLEVQDWTKVRRDIRAQTVASTAVAIVLMVVIATVIPLMVNRYVSRPLAELSARVMRFSADDSERSAGSEVEQLGEEFGRLDQQLIGARSDLEQRHRHELELERELQRADRLATIGALAAGLAHEIGTPMGVIRVRAEDLQQDQAISPEARAKLGIIVRQIDRIARIVRMLLDYARKSESHKAICDLRTIAERALTLMEPEAARRNVRTVVQLGENPLPVNCDADQIEQVFVNMIMNALDAMNRGGGTLRVAADAEQARDGSRATLAFEDTGAGVAPEHEARLFSPFFTTKEPGKGTGMGLAVSQSIVREHDGEITFSSGSSGSRFVVAIPMAASETVEHERGSRQQRRA
ncbi:MAG: sensor histidine kinase [Candidatus Binatus sp.]